MNKRQLIADDQVIVILDTCAVRVHPKQTVKPPWVEAFAEMASDGYSFSLAEGTAAELLTQVQSGRTPLECHHQMMEWIGTFLNPEVPVLASLGDIDGMIGLDEHWNIEEARCISRVAWSMLLNPLQPCDPYRPTFDLLLEEMRQEWIQRFTRLKHAAMCFGIDVANSDPTFVMNYFVDLVGSTLDRRCDLIPPESMRRDLELKYWFQQFVRTYRTKFAYNPTSKKARNDGPDFHLYSYLVLPALVVSTDGGFFSSLTNLKSFQKKWFVRPNDLAERWRAGEHLAPSWPASDKFNESFPTPH